MFNIDRRLIKNFDWMTLSVVIIIIFIGIMTIYSTTRPIVDGENSRFYVRQAIWLMIGITGLFLMVSFDYVWLSRLSIFLYIAGIASLIAVFIFGKAGLGAQRWINLGPSFFRLSDFFRFYFLLLF